MLLAFYFLQEAQEYGEMRVTEVRGCNTLRKDTILGALFANIDLLNNIVTVRARQSSGVCGLRNA